jgi:hypothetical protein
MFILFLTQEIKRWKYNRFESYKVNTLETATWSLPQGEITCAATRDMLKDIIQDKKQIATLTGIQCGRIWLEAAELCELTYACPSTPGRRLACAKLGEIGLAWKQDAGPLNCKRIAFIFDYYGTEVYQRALSTTHQETTCYQIMDSLNIVMDVTQSDMPGGQKTCMQQQYSATSNIRKNNILCMGVNKHHVRVNREMGNA